MRSYTYFKWWCERVYPRYQRVTSICKWNAHFYQFHQLLGKLPCSPFGTTCEVTFLLCTMFPFPFTKIKDIADASCNFATSINPNQSWTFSLLRDLKQFAFVDQYIKSMGSFYFGKRRFGFLTCLFIIWASESLVSLHLAEYGRHPWGFASFLDAFIRI